MNIFISSYTKSLVTIEKLRTIEQGRGDDLIRYQVLSKNGPFPRMKLSMSPLSNWSLVMHHYPTSGTTNALSGNFLFKP